MRKKYGIKVGIIIFIIILSIFMFEKYIQAAENQPISNGIYEIEVGVDSNKALEVIDARNDSGANVQIFRKNNAKCQKVKIQYLSDGYYILTFVHSNKVLDVANGNKANHTNVWQCNYNGSDAQKWKLKYIGNGYYNIISKLDNKYLTVLNGGTANCTNIEINKNLGNNSQKFRLNKIEAIKGKKTIEDGTYEIETGVDSNKALEVINAYNYSGANVQIFRKNNAKCQRVNVKYLGDGYYTIEFVHSKKMLDVSDGKIENHTNVWQCNTNGTDAQKWIIKDAGNGYYNIISKLSNTYLTVANGGTANCTNIEINSVLNNNSQKFKFNKIKTIKGQKTIEDGTYEIETGVDSNKALEVINAYNYSGANVQIFRKNNAKCQRVNVKYLGDGYYTIEFVHSKKMLDVSDGKIENHTNVWQCNTNGTDAQKWIIKDAGNGYYNIISKLSNTYLTVANGGTANCTNIEINSLLNNNSQKFKFNKIKTIKGQKTIEDGTYEIETGVDSNKALEVVDASKLSGANVQIFRKNNANCQKVKVKYQGDGYYIITFLHSQKALDVSNGNIENHTNVWQCNANGTDAQKWIIRDAGNGYYNIISKLSNTYLTVANGGIANCTNIEICSANESKSQKFKFNKLETIEAKKSIDTGLYEIEVGVDRNKALDVIDARTNSGANVQIFTKNKAKCQKVIVDYLGNGYYTLKFLHSEMALGVANARTENHTNVCQSKPDETDAQKWIIKDAGNGYYNIISKLSNIYLTVANGGTANCTNIEVNSKLNNSSQKFKFNRLNELYGIKTIDDGLYEVETGVASNKALDVVDARTDSGANVQIHTKNNANCQKVQVTYVGDGYYNLEFLHSGMMLDVANGNTSNHTNVWQCRNNGTDAQKWIIRDLHDGYYTLISKSSKKYLTVANGTNVEIDAENSQSSQKFKFNKTRISGEEGVYGYSGLVHKGSANGSQLKYYKYGFGNNVLFATFAVHGFEDNWYRDGQALTEIAKRFYNKLVNDNDIYIAKNWTVYIFPSVNPDGEYYGQSNNGPGRRTLWSWAPGNQGIDINRNWQCSGISYKRFTDSRNYNGTAGFQAYEAGALKDFLVSHKSYTGKNLVIDLHGWENSLIGDSGILDYYYPSFSYATKKYGQYGQQYLISWARTDLGAQSALIELPGWIHNMQDVANNDLYNKYINSSINMLKNMSISSPIKLKLRAAYKSNSLNNITDDEQFNIAYAGLIKGDVPNNEEVEKYKQQQPSQSGVYIEKKSQTNILNLINDVTNLKYEIDEKDYLKLKEKQDKNKNNEYDNFIQKLINSNELYILGRTGKLYFKDTITKQITEDSYEDLDSYQTYNYVEYNEKKIIDVTLNKKRNLSNKEIVDSLVELLK